MANKIPKLILGLLCLLLYFGPSSQHDKLEQGQELKFREELFSAEGKFKLGFFNLTSNHYYIGIWHNDDNRAREDSLVWVANRDNPILNNPGSLTIDDNGNLTITHNGNLSIVLYSGHEATNASAVLKDNGNFVLCEKNSRRQLWQSFDCPSHTLLPGMKLGVNRKTGHTWSLTSWRDKDVPDSGNFTFGLHPNLTDQLVILLHGEIYWNSSSLRLTKSNSSFNYISNEDETFFCYSEKTNSPQLTIDYLGILSDDSGATLVDCTSASSILRDGCVAQTEGSISTNRWWIWLIVLAGGIIITLLCLLCYAKLKKHIAKGN